MLTEPLHCETVSDSIARDEASRFVNTVKLEQVELAADRDHPPTILGYRSRPVRDYLKGEFSDILERHARLPSPCKKSRGLLRIDQRHDVAH